MQYLLFYKFTVLSSQFSVVVEKKKGFIKYFGSPIVLILLYPYLYGRIEMFYNISIYLPDNN